MSLIIFFYFFFFIYFAFLDYYFLLEDELEEDEREKIQLTVYAGKRCFVPLVVAGRNYELTWEFTSTPKVTN